MKENYIKKYWFCCVVIVILLLSVIFVEVSRALGTTIILDSLDSSSTEYKVTNYSSYSVVEITEGGEYTLSQNDINSVVNANIIVDSDEDVTLILDGINVKAGSYLQKSVFSDAQYGTAAISIQGDTNCKIVLKDDSVNTLTGYTEYDSSNNPVNNSFYHTAAISVENTIVDGDVRLASLTIEGENGNISNGILNANGGNQSAAIGANCNRLTGNITINSGVINAVSGDYGAAIGDGDTVQGNGSRYDEKNGAIVWVVGETNSVATIEVNGGELWATATKDTPGIGTADNLVDGYHAEVDIWTGLQIEVNGGVVVAIGGVQAYNPSSAIGPGSNTFVSSNNIVINKGEGDAATQIIAVTRTDSGSYPVSNSGGDAIPVLSADSTASILNVKFSEPKVAKQLDFWYYVDPTYSIDPTSDFPNLLLERMGDIEVLGLAVLLPEGKYKITQDTDNNGADEDDPTLDEGLIVGGAGSITCDENSSGNVSCRYPLEVRSPSDLTVISGDSASFDVEVLQHSEGSALTYQWYISTDLGSTWNILVGETSTEYVISEALLSDSSNLYRCDVTENFYGEKVVLSSLPAKLTVLRELEYDIDINVKLDGNLYTSNDSTFELYDSVGNKISDLNLIDGVLKAIVPAKTYRIYIDGIDIGKDFVVTESTNSFDINYYSVNLEIVSDNDEDFVTIDGVNYFDNTSLNQIVYLEGTNINMVTNPQGESEVVAVSINSNDVLDNLNNYTILVDKTINANVEFDYKKYGIQVNINLNDNIYSDIVGIFELKGSNNYSLNNINGVLSGDVVAGTYSLYRDSELIKDNIVVDRANTIFEVNYYTIDLILNSDNDGDSVTIGNACYYDSVVDRIFILEGKSVPIKAIASDDMKVNSYFINNTSGDVSDIVNGIDVVVNEKKELYVEFARVEYDIVINAFLDNSSYTSLSSVYELYSGDNSVLKLANNNGVYTGAVISGNYKLYIDGADSGILVEVSADSLSFEVNYFTVSTLVNSPSDSNYVLLNNENINELIVIDGTKINVKAIVDSEVEVISYDINQVSNDINKVVSGDELTINDTTNIEVSFEVVKYDINIVSLLDNDVYQGNVDKFDLYLDGTKIVTLPNNKGIYSGDVVSGNYDLYINDQLTDIDINVSSSSLNFEVNYYTINLELISSNNNDGVLINDVKYVDDVNGNIVVLENSTISLKAVSDVERKVIEYTVNDLITDVSSIVSGYTINVSDTTNLYIKFDVITYDITINNYLDGVLYSDILGEFKLYNDNDVFISDLNNNSGILDANIPAGCYKLLLDGKKILELNVTSNNRKFDINYYSINLILNSITGEDVIEINNSCFKSNTVKNEIVVLEGTSVPIKAVLESEMYISGYTINGENSSVDELVDGYNLVINETTDIVININQISYDIIINTNLDDDSYSSNNNLYSLHDNNGNKVVSLNNNDGKLSGNVVVGDYYLFENDIKTNVVLNVSSSALEFDVNYYTVNVDLVNNNGIDYILLNNNKYTDDLSDYVVLSGTEIEIKSVPDTERSVIKYSVNGNVSDVNDVLDGKKYLISGKNSYVVEYAFIEYSINIDINIDGYLYKDISSEFDLYDKDNKKYELTLSNGNLTGKVIYGDYYIYQDGINTGKKITVNSNSVKFVIDYYSVSLDLECVTDGDSVTINGISYNSDVSSIIILKGNKISLKSNVGNEKEVNGYTINSEDANINDLLKGYDVTINETTKIFVEFKYVQYPIEIKVLLDDKLYETLEGVFTLYDNNGEKISNLTRSNGVLSTSLESGTYYLYKDGVNTNYSIDVSDNVKNFEMLYYSVNLDIKTTNILDNVEINGISYSENTKDEEIVLLKGSEVNVKLNPSTDTEVYDLTLNNVNITINDKFDFNVDNKKKIYVEFGNKRYDSVVNVYIDDDLSSIDKVISFDFIKDGVVYSPGDKFVNGNYQIRLNGTETKEFVEVNKGIINVYFYNVFLDADVGISNLNGENLYLKGSNVLIEATLKPGYKYLGWSLGSEVLDTGLSYEIVDISKRYDLKATSSALVPYEPVLNPVNGNYEYGSLVDKEISLEVIPYDGTIVDSYQWYKCTDSECFDKIIIDGAVRENYLSSEVDVDQYYYYNEVVILREDNGEKLVTGSIVTLNIVPITPIITLNNKVVYYTGEDINIDEGVLDNIIGDDKFDITYKYYLDENLTILTDSENSGALTVGGAPVNVGTYFVSMVLEGNKNYNEVSTIAKLDIIEPIQEEVKIEEVVEEENPNTLDKVVLVIIALVLGGLVMIKSYINTSKYHV